MLSGPDLTMIVEEKTMKLIKRTQLYSLCKMVVLVLVLLNVSSALWGFVYSEAQVDQFFSSTAPRTDDSVRSMLTHLKHVLAYQLPVFTENESASTIRSEQDTDQSAPDDHSLLVRIARSYTTFDHGSSTLASSAKTFPHSSGIAKRIQLLLIGGVLLTIGAIFIPAFFPQLHQQSEKNLHAFQRPSPQFSEKTLRMKRRVQSTSLRRTGCATMETVLPLASRQSEGQVSGDISREKDSVEEIFTAHDMIQSHETRSSLSAFQETFAVPGDILQTFFRQSGFEYDLQFENYQVLHPTSTPYQRFGDIPLFIMTDSRLDVSAIQTIHETIVSRSQSHAVQLAFIVVDTPPSPDAYKSLYTYKLEEHILLLLIPIQLVHKGLRQNTSAHILGKLLNIALKGNNPYETSIPVENPLDFFGREDIINTLLDAVSHLQHVGLFGLRKIGKTSLIWQIRAKLSRHLVAYIDLQQMSQDLPSVYQAILAECLREAAYKYPEVALPDFSFDRQQDPGEQFGQILVRLWECLKSRCQDLKIVVLFDEAEHLIPAVRDPLSGFSGFHHLVGTIRGISQQDGFLVSVMVSSSPDISRLDTWKGQNNPGFQYYKEVFVSTLSEEECNRMITTLGIQAGIKYTEESLSRIYYETGGHPYVTRQLCGFILKRLLARQTAHTWRASNMKEQPDSGDTFYAVEVKTVEYAVAEYLEYKRNYLESIWQRLPQTEQEILLIIIGNESCALDDLIASHQSHHIKRERRKAISMLIENEIIEKCENKYSIRMGLFARYLLTTN